MRQDGIQRRGAVALGQDEAVPVRVLGVLGIHPHHVEIQNSQNVHGRDTEPPRCPDAAVVDHVQAQKPPLGRDDFQPTHIIVHIVASSSSCVRMQIRYSVTRKFSKVNSLSPLQFDFRCFIMGCVPFGGERNRISQTYPGVAQLVGRLLWEQEAARSSRATRTNGSL